MIQLSDEFVILVRRLLLRIGGFSFNLYITTGPRLTASPLFRIRIYPIAVAGRLREVEQAEWKLANSVVGRYYGGGRRHRLNTDLKESQCCTEKEREREMSDRPRPSVAI